MKFHIYKAKDGWRWRLIARNGKIIAESGEAYQRQLAAWKGIQRIRLVAIDASIVYD